MRSGAGFLSGLQARKLGSTLFLFLPRISAILVHLHIRHSHRVFLLNLTVCLGFAFALIPCFFFGLSGINSPNFAAMFLCFLPFCLSTRNHIRLLSPFFSFCSGVYPLFALFVYFHVTNHSETLPADSVQWGGEMMPGKVDRSITPG